MNLYLLNDKLDKIALISAYTSLIWVRRYNDVGEFELYISAQTMDISLFQEDQFLMRDDDETVMIVEKIQLPEDIEKGDYIIVSGRSSESLLDRRINMTRFFVGNYSNLFDIIYPLFEKNFLHGAGEIRKIDIINFPLLDGYEVNEPIYVSTDRYGVSIYEFISEVCKNVNHGFSFVKKNVDGVDKLNFTLYKGIDRSARQDVNPRIMFTPNFGNLLSSDYQLDRSSEKTVAYIAGEGEGSERKSSMIGRDTSGLKRKELYVDARDLSSTNQSESGEEVKMSDIEYEQALQQRGEEKLKEFKLLETFDFLIDISRTYRYRTDFKVGDIVTGQNKYGLQAHARIIEMSEVFDEQGYRLVPKVEGVE